MNAKELHDLYRPLWAKVPETRPVAWSDDGYGLSIEPAGDDYEALYNGERIPPGILGAIFRVAVEDWLRAKRRIQLNEKAEGDEQIAEWVLLTPDTGYDNHKNIFRAGPTIHHALVAAALAVAEGK